MNPLALSLADAKRELRQNTQTKQRIVNELTRRPHSAEYQELYEDALKIEIALLACIRMRTAPQQTI